MLYLLIAQDLSQIEMKYSKANIETIVSTTAAKLILPLNNEQTAKRFASGAAQKFAPGETVYDVGTRNTPTWLVLKGTIDIGRRDGLNHEAPIATLGIGQFTGEVGQLSGRATLAPIPNGTPTPMHPCGPALRLHPAW